MTNERINVDPRPQPRGSTALCEVCGMEVRQYPSRPRRFCSLSCRDKANRTGPTVECICQVCGGRYMLCPRAALRSKYCSRVCAGSQGRKGRPPSPLGTEKLHHGYVQVKVGRSHWASQGNGWALMHRVVMGEGLGRPLFAHENVHHINGIKTDNRPENLELWVTSQPQGQRLQDVLAWAREILDIYTALA